MDNDFFPGLIVGMFLGILVVFFSENLSTNSVRNKYYRAIEECEKNLPRSENCVIVALPRSKD